MNYDTFECHQVAVPVFRPSSQEFKDFSKYISSIEEAGAHKIGLAKVYFTFTNSFCKYFLFVFNLFIDYSTG